MLLQLLLAAASSLAAPSSFCASAGWNQVWSDEFREPTLNTSKWSVRATVRGTGGGNVDRLAKVAPDDIYMEDGALVLRTQKRGLGGPCLVMLCKQ